MAQRIRAVVVTMFGENVPPDRGETAAFLDAWAPAEKLPAGALSLWQIHGDTLLVRTGIGPANTAAAMLQLGLDGRFDLRESTWIIAGIAGIDPARGQLGQVCLVDWCVDGDLAFEFHGSDIPPEWSTGILPLGSKKPFDPERSPEELFEGTRFRFDLRGQTFDRACESLGPDVLVGTVLSAGRFWHGRIGNDWARRWVDYWTRGASSFLVAGMEDTGTLTALHRLGALGRVNSRRVIILRAASNFTMPTDATPATDSLLSQGEDYVAPGLAPALLHLVQATERLLAGLH